MSRVPLLHDQFESDFVPPLSDIEALETEKPRSQNLHGRKSKFWQLQALALCLIISFSGGFLAGYLTLLPLSAIKRFFEPSPTTSLSPTGFHPRCSSPGIRHEWRSLSRSQQEAYITAVKCLKRKPSRLNLNQTLYDDFPYIHASIGEYCKFHETSIQCSSRTESRKLITLPRSSCGTGTSCTYMKRRCKKTVGTRDG